ncbi:MAG: EF-hand domain-containing protein [Silvibacterium sp.]|nr:EF-hand domain-containing protein [Silvibacterium sp.]
MPKRRIFVWTMEAVFAAGIVAGTAIAADNTQKVDAGIPATKQLLLLMDTDRNGKVSKQEFMNFMEAEFNRLDINHDGELDVHELTQLQVRPKGGYHR